MARYFNTTGRCDPEEHYVVDPLRGMYPEIRRLIEAKQYFLIHAPRQTGKTTLLHALARRLNAEGKYISIVSSLESAGFQDITVAEANWAIVSSLRDNAELFLDEEHMPPVLERYSPTVTLFQRYLQDWCRGLPKPLVLLLDEVDALYDDVLVSVLRQLRDGFQRRPRLFPQSVALVGLRDIREYRLKARGENPSLGAGSPFNVKAESFFLPVFSEAEVRTLLGQHTQETGQVFTEEAIQKLYAYSGGQPWLTNALANEIVAKMLKNDYTQPITADMVEEAKERL
ncbi:MAG: ATP-binding protein, partial [Saprospiraceae bacterium]|nr:ATP-binding protein [Saprospiraceae bacterium]MDW8483232.1 ATP-binding protein [Saprospiraceae bacterium]